MEKLGRLMKPGTRILRLSSSLWGPPQTPSDIGIFDKVFYCCYDGVIPAELVEVVSSSQTKNHMRCKVCYEKAFVFGNGIRLRKFGFPDNGKDGYDPD